MPDTVKREVNLLTKDAQDLDRKAKAAKQKRGEYIRGKLGYQPKLATGAAAHKKGKK